MEWFNGTAKVKREEVKTYHERWFCPMENCTGEMIYTGMSWPMNPPGYHHKCNVCGCGRAMEGKSYPRYVHDREDG